MYPKKYPHDINTMRVENIMPQDLARTILKKRVCKNKILKRNTNTLNVNDSNQSFKSVTVELHT